MICVALLQKYSYHLEFFHILSHYNNKPSFILLGFYVKSQHKVLHNYMCQFLKFFLLIKSVPGILIFICLL